MSSAPDPAAAGPVGVADFEPWLPVEGAEIQGSRADQRRGQFEEHHAAPHEPPRRLRRGAGVVQHDIALAQPGLNLLSSRAVAGAQLVDLSGQIVHRWQPPASSEEGWNHVELMADGDLLVVSQKPSLIRLDRNSERLWERAWHVHHDLAVSAQGEIFALERSEIQRDVAGQGVRLLGENVLRLTRDGELISRVALHDLLAESLTPERIAAARAATPDPRSWAQKALDLWRAPPVDLFHANSIEILPRDVPGLGPAGAALVSLRNLDLVVAVDLAAPAIVWRLGPGVVERQHQVSLLPNDRTLIFDNGRARRHSRVVEVDPASGAIVWEYSGTPPGSLRSRSQGGAEFLANGNLLVVESERGRAIEITRALPIGHVGVAVEHLEHALGAGEFFLHRGDLADHLLHRWEELHHQAGEQEELADGQSLALRQIAGDQEEG